MEESAPYLEAAEKKIDFTGFDIDGQSAYEQSTNLGRKGLKCCRRMGVETYCFLSRRITVPNLVIRSRFCVHGPNCTSVVLCARLAQFSDSVSALGAEVLVTCSVTTWKALQPSTIFKWPLLFPAAAWHNQQVTLHDVRIFFPAWHSIANFTWKESHWDALISMTTVILRRKNHCFSPQNWG